MRKVWDLCGYSYFALDIFDFDFNFNFLDNRDEKEYKTYYYLFFIVKDVLIFYFIF